MNSTLFSHIKPDPPTPTLETSAVVAVLETVSHIPEATRLVADLRAGLPIGQDTIDQVRQVRVALIAESVPDFWVDDSIDLHDWVIVEDIISERERQGRVLGDWLNSFTAEIT